jgi:hypothetical protein
MERFQHINQFGRLAKYVKFNNNTYFEYGKGYYMKTSTPHTFLHHDIWRSYGNDIPKGYELHHKDGDSRNDVIENYELLTKSQHTKLHYQTRVLRSFVCEQCNDSFYTKALWTRFCPVCALKRTNKRARVYYEQHKIQCQQAQTKRYHSDKNLKSGICFYCGNVFFSRTMHINQCCGHSCAMKYRASLKPRSCSIIGCMNKFYAKGYCKNHYRIILHHR